MQIKVAKKERALNKTERGEWRERPETATCEFDRTTACKGGKMRCTHGSIECGATAALCKKKLSTSHASLLNYLPVYDSCAAATSTCLHHRHHWACLHSSTMPLFRIIPPLPFSERWGNLSIPSTTRQPSHTFSQHCLWEINASTSLPCPCHFYMYIIIPYVTILSIIYFWPPFLI